VIFNKHFNLVGTHAFLSASNPHWVNDDDEKFDRRYDNAVAAKRGTDLHALAHDLIRMGVRLPDIPETMNLYVNDAIDYGMTPEQPLFYSPNCYGTPDAIGFGQNLLRIHDLKTGATRTKVLQLLVYSAIFCLEYMIKPFDIETELRIYQSDEVRVYPADPDEITHIMDRIVVRDERIEARRAEMEA